MENNNILARGRQALKDKAWSDAYSLLSEAEENSSLEPEDLERLSKAAYLIGREEECVDIWSRAEKKFRKGGRIQQAAYAAFWIGMILANRGDHAQAGGWFTRAGRLLEEVDGECPEQGFLMIPQALQHLRGGETDEARELFERAAEIGDRTGSTDLLTLGRLGLGQTLVFQNKFEEGTSLFDEAMVSVVSDEISPIVAGIVYCAVIDTCHKIYDLRRAQEWTTALSRWCDSQPDLIPYRGQCMVRRAELMQLHGEWPEALKEARKACELSRKSSPPAGGGAFYRRAELYRLRGEFSKAEEMYMKASEEGRKPQPGMALMRLAQGRVDAAVASIRTAEEDARDRNTRSRILPAYVTIMLAADDPEAAEESARELSEIALELKAPYLRALANRAEGHVLMAREDHRAALNKLRDAWSALNKMEASYESARTRVLIGLACRKLGDGDTAKLELKAAQRLFRELGAEPDMNRVASIIGESSEKSGHGLTPRELEVLKLLATGKTNKAIASELYISERTVDRHVSNILGKLDLPSRAAATAYAFKHDLT